MVNERLRGLGAVVDAGRQRGWEGEESPRLVPVGTVIGVAECDDGDGG
jgi:hypothetical protein